MILSSSKEGRGIVLCGGADCSIINVLSDAQVCDPRARVCDPVSSAISA